MKMSPEKAVEKHGWAGLGWGEIFSVWISPEGKFIRSPTHLGDHIAQRILGIETDDVGVLYNGMFNKGWIKALVDRDEENVLYLQNSFRGRIRSLEELPRKQRDAIMDWAMEHDIQPANADGQVLSMLENMGEQTEQQQVTDPELKKRLGQVYAYVARRLGIQSPPKIILSKDRKNADDPFGKTGYYDHTTKTIRLYLTDRHETDILRSFAHELVHHWQNERGTLHPKGMEDNVPGNDKDVPPYAQNDPWLRKREMEAYLFGCMLFRDWQDENRSGPPPVEPFLPQPYD